MIRLTSNAVFLNDCSITDCPLTLNNEKESKFHKSFWLYLTILCDERVSYYVYIYSTALVIQQVN